MTYDMARYTDRMHDACLKVMYLLVAALLCIRQERRDATQRNATQASSGLEQFININANKSFAGLQHQQKELS